MAERNEAWFEELFRAHHTAVLAYASRRNADADDVVAETFAIAWRSRDRLSDPALPWLYRTAANVIANQRRGHLRRTRLVQRIAGYRRDDAGDTAVGGLTEVDADAARVHSALAMLPDRDCEVLRLAAWEELDSAGIAAVLGCTPGAAKARLHRARRRFREAWLACGPIIDRLEVEAEPA